MTHIEKKNEEHDKKLENFLRRNNILIFGVETNAERGEKMSTFVDKMPSLC